MIPFKITIPASYFLLVYVSTSGRVNGNYQIGIFSNHNWSVEYLYIPASEQIKKSCIFLTVNLYRMIAGAYIPDDHLIITWVKSSAIDNNTDVPLANGFYGEHTFCFPIMVSWICKNCYAQH